MQSKRTIKIFSTTPQCPLGYSDRLIYSYLAYQDRYDNHPSNRSVAKATGLCVATVGKSLQRLASFGLYQQRDDSETPRCVLPPANHAAWFVSAETTLTHWSGPFAAWRCFIRRPGSPLAVSSIVLYSWLLHCIETRWQPKFGITTAYLSATLGMDCRTVDNALDQLKSCKLVDKSAAYCVRLPNEQQLAWFSDIEKQYGEGLMIEAGEPVPACDLPVCDTKTETGVDNDKELCRALLDHIKLIYPTDGQLQEEELRRCYGLIINKPDWRVPERQREYIRQVFVTN